MPGRAIGVPTGDAVTADVLDCMVPVAVVSSAVGLTSPEPVGTAVSVAVGVGVFVGTGV